MKGVDESIQVLGVYLRPILVLSDVPVSRNWYKSVSQLYKNSNLYLLDFLKLYEVLLKRFFGRKLTLPSKIPENREQRHLAEK